ncbi:hypothetical protein HYPSUDRAFT_39260 [Hypholoma sublateritium FD-334 SS-4]|uniref:Uncharacterized protein n=1 Tax=Hypholoma sublateritium (strain FD-334 SS-4) TaxID=945553 RepID=A0A0D2MK90_HYPSF|nr:hypothetical protein HYPSUDRAFT_39260 [Hypholoma sublateritium FD-334 SS-4]
MPHEPQRDGSNVYDKDVVQTAIIGTLSCASIGKVVIGYVHVGIYSHGLNLDTVAYYHGTIVNCRVSGSFRDH